MSGIFNLLGGLAESDRGQITPMARSKTSHEIRLNSVKTLAGTKPKGLSIRSNSDMNVSSVNSAKKNAHGKEQDCLKLKVTQIDNNGRPISPEKETPAKKQIAQSSKFKESALNEETNKYTKNQSSDGVFKKPLIHKKSFKKLPEPEKLVHWYDYQHDFDYGYIEAAEREFKDLLSKGKKNRKLCETNVLLTDSETLLLPIPELILDTSFDEEYKKFLSPDLLEISDNENL